MTIYANFLYDPQQSFGAGTITSLTRNQIQLRKAYLLLGNLNAFPIYLALGKFTAPFGLTHTVNPFTTSIVGHTFGGLAYGIKLSYYKAGLKMSAELAQGGSQFRAVKTSVDGTGVPSRLNNGVFDASYNYQFSKDNGHVRVGASYLIGSVFCTKFPSKHFDPCDSDNPAFDVYS